MNSYFKSILKFLGLGIIWVFILSYRIDGRPIFYGVSNILVENQVVNAVINQLELAANDVSKLTRESFAKITGHNDRI